MNREQLIRALRAYARKRDLRFEVAEFEGKGSHYRVRVGTKKTTVQMHLDDPNRIKRILKQLEVDPADL